MEEAAVELGVGGGQGRIGVNLIVAAEVRDGKEQVYNANGKAVGGTYWKNNLWQGQGAKSFIAKWKASTSAGSRNSV